MHGYRNQQVGVALKNQIFLTSLRWIWNEHVVELHKTHRPNTRQRIMGRQHGLPIRTFIYLTFNPDYHLSTCGRLHQQQLGWEFAITALVNTLTIPLTRANTHPQTHTVSSAKKEKATQDYRSHTNKFETINTKNKSAVAPHWFACQTRSLISRCSMCVCFLFYLLRN